MVGVFRRSLSFPNKISPARPSKPPLSAHARSISLPCRSHPLISHINDEISQLQSWFSVGGTRTVAWLTDGLNRLKDLHDSLAELVHPPQSHLALRSSPALVNTLLEDLLRFVDAFGIFQTSLMALRDVHSAMHVALRRQDGSKILSCLKSRDRIAKEIAKLATALRSAKPPIQVTATAGSISDAELAGVMCDVIEVTVSVSVAIFDGVRASFRACDKTASLGRSLGFVWRGKKVKVADAGIEELKRFGAVSLNGLRKKKDDEVRNMREFEEAVSEIENVSDKVFRSLINTRVSLLNAFTME